MCIFILPLLAAFVSIVITVLWRFCLECRILFTGISVFLSFSYTCHNLSVSTYERNCTTEVLKNLVSSGIGLSNKI